MKNNLKLQIDPLGERISLGLNWMSTYEELGGWFGVEFLFFGVYILWEPKESTHV